MPTKTELADSLAKALTKLTTAGDRIGTLQGEVKTARSAAADAEARAAAARASHDSVMREGHAKNTEIARLEAKLAEPQATPAPARPKGSTVVLGALGLRTGLLCITDPFCLDRSWKTMTNAMGSAFGIDIHGENAETLAQQEKRYKATLLADGTWRVEAPDQTSAAYLHAQVKNLVKARGWATTVKVHPLLATTEVMRDACRESDVGFAKAVDGTDILAVSLPVRSSIQVVGVRDDNGDLRELRLVLPSRR